MAFLSLLPDRLCEWFSDKNEFSDCSFCTLYPPGFKSTPITRPVVVMGTKSIDVIPCDPETSRVRKVEEKISIGIYVPRTMGGSYCTGILERIIEQLLFNCDIYVIRMLAKGVEYVRDADSLFLDAEIEIQEGFAEDPEGYTDRFVM